MLNKKICTPSYILNKKQANDTFSIISAFLLPRGFYYCVGTIADKRYIGSICSLRCRRRKGPGRKWEDCKTTHDVNHPLYFTLPKLEEVQHNYHLRLGANYHVHAPPCISPSKYKPPKLVTQKNPPINHHSKYKPPGACTRKLPSNSK